MRSRKMRTSVLTLMVTVLTLWVSAPAQAAVPEQPRLAVVGHATIVNELGEVNELPILGPANGVAYELFQLRSLSACPDGHTCAWIDSNYGGSMLDIVWSITHGHCNNLFNPWQDSISSTYTRFGSDYGMNWYQDTSCPQGTFTHYVQGARTPIPSFTVSWNDQFTSFHDNCCS